MVDAAQIQRHVNRGYAKAGSILGSAFTQYRATGANDPTAVANAVGAVSAAFDTAPALPFSKPSQYGKPDWYAAVDPTCLQVGDYLIGQVNQTPSTFFLAAVENFDAPHFIRCNHTIQIARAADTLAPGSTGTYSGSAIETATPFMTGWPCALLQLSSGSKMGGTGMQLPSDGKLPGAAAWLPATCPQIRFNDIITDENGVRYAVSSAELTPLGWRLVAEVWPSA